MDWTIGLCGEGKDQWRMEVENHECHDSDGGFTVRG